MLGATPCLLSSRLGGLGRARALPVIDATATLAQRSGAGVRIGGGMAARGSVAGCTRKVDTVILQRRTNDLASRQHVVIHPIHSPHLVERVKCSCACVSVWLVHVAVWRCFRRAGQAEDFFLIIKFLTLVCPPKTLTLKM